MIHTYKTTSEKCRLTKCFISAFIKKSKDLKILISHHYTSVHLSPQSGYEVRHDYATNQQGSFTSQLLFDGFSPQPIGKSNLANHYKKMEEDMNSNEGHEIIIVHDPKKTYYSYRNYSVTYNIQATEELTKILREGKLPIMHIRGRKETIPLTRKSQTSSRGARTTIQTGQLRVVNEITKKEKVIKADIELKGNYLTSSYYLNRFTVTSDFNYTDGALTINLRGAEIIYTMDHYDGVYRGELVKTCNVQEWRKFRIQDFLGDSGSF